MPKRATPLTAAKVRTAAAGTYVDGAGLMLLVQASGAATWILRYSRSGKRRDMGLGPARGLGAVGLAEAREKVAEARKLLRQGMDPIERRKASLAAQKAAGAASAEDRTFLAVAETYIAANEAGWHNAKHRYQWRATLATYAFPHMGKLPVADLETRHVLAALEPIWTTKPETASRLRGRIESVLDYAAARGWRSGENPARWRGHLANLLPRPSRLARVEHHPALAWKEIGAFLATLREREGMAARAMEFCILTASRTGEVLGARWSEIDMQDATWTVPAERMKAGVEHRVPLSEPALAILAAVEPLRQAGGGGQSAFIFPSGANLARPMSSMTMLMMLRRMGRRDLTVHGFRSTFRDWVAEHTGFDRDTAEEALAHTLQNKVEAAYRRGDLFEKRKRLMAAWAAFCDQPFAGGAVVPIRQTAG